MRQLIEKIKERSEKINALLNCESIDNEQVAEEAKAIYYEITDLHAYLKTLSGARLQGNNHDVVHVHNVVKLICNKTFPVLKREFKDINGRASVRLSFYEIALKGLCYAMNKKIKQLSAIRVEQQKPYGKKHG